MGDKKAILIICYLSLAASCYNSRDIRTFPRPLVPNAVASQENTTDTASQCPQCRCYTFDCSIIPQPDIDCQDQFSDTCNSFDQIVPDYNCQNVCDCCSDGVCLKWTDVSCFVFIVYGFINSLSLLFISLFVYCIMDFIDVYFSLELKEEAEDLRLEKEITELRQLQTEGTTQGEANRKKYKKIKVKYQRFILFRMADGEENKISSIYLPTVKSLFEQLDELKPVAQKNAILIGLLVLCALAVGLSTVLNFFVPNKTVMYFGVLTWVKNCVFVVMFILTMIGYFKLSRFSEEFETKLKNFESETGCKVKLSTDKKVFKFEIPKKVSTEGGIKSERDTERDYPESSKSFFNGRSEDQSEDVDDSKMFLNSVKNRRTLDKIKNNQIAPV